MNDFKCICPSGLTGKHCDQKVGSFCANNPCLHGTCIEEPDRFVCNCKPGFTGQFCESQINVSFLCHFFKISSTIVLIHSFYNVHIVSDQELVIHEWRED